MSKAQGAGSGITRLSYKKGAEHELNRRARSGTDHCQPMYSRIFVLQLMGSH